jgi:hypothetical protein
MAGRTYVRKGQVVTDRNILEQKAIEASQVSASMEQHGIDMVMWGGSWSNEWVQCTAEWLLSIVYQCDSNYKLQTDADGEAVRRDYSGQQYVAKSKVVLDAEPVVMVSNNLRAVRYEIEGSGIIGFMKPCELLQNQANVLMAWARGV